MILQSRKLSCIIPYYSNRWTFSIAKKRTHTIREKEIQKGIKTDCSMLLEIIISKSKNEKKKIQSVASSTYLHTTHTRHEGYNKESRQLKAPNKQFSVFFLFFFSFWLNFYMSSHFYNLSILHPLHSFFSHVLLILSVYTFLNKIKNQKRFTQQKTTNCVDGL